MAIESEMLWHNDGHILTLQIAKAELKIIDVFCPFESQVSGECHHPEHGCLVQEFAYRYGLDCNVGACPAVEKMQICWTRTSATSDIDSMQIWFMPLNDDVFSAWLSSKQ